MNIFQSIFCKKKVEPKIVKPEFNYLEVRNKMQSILHDYYDTEFKKWYDELIKLENSYVNNTDYYKKYFTDIEYCKLEEGAFDIISLNLDLNITPIVDIMYGETYTHIKNMSTTKNVCFHHYHLYDKYNLNNYNFIKDKLLFYNEYS
jgi:hypothetical protein